MEFYNFFANLNGQSQVNHFQNGFNDFPCSLDFVWILGKKYNTIHDVDDLRTAIRSKIWFSYRSGFPPIGGTGPKTDKHWGCMLRCGQMVMAEALVRRHLGKDWIWSPDVYDPIYLEILRMFQDHKDCTYSLHQLAQMGVSEGKAIGEWFGPNAVAQVLRCALEYPFANEIQSYMYILANYYGLKLSIYDEWSSIAIYVASASAVIKNDVYTLCQHVPKPLTPNLFESYNSHWFVDCAMRQQQKMHITSYPKSDTWRAMLLFIPLRLGLSSINPIYYSVFKNTFKMKHSLGILGGRPRHAVWFIGFTGDDLICLDPHTTQSTVDLSDDKIDDPQNCEGQPNEGRRKKIDDSSFHVPYGGSKRMLITDVDPSLSLCFYIESQEDFEEWCSQVQNMLVSEDKKLMFEILEDRPKEWPPFDLRPDLNCSRCSLDYDFVVDGASATLSEDDFENIEAASCSFKSLDQDFSLI